MTISDTSSTIHQKEGNSGIQVAKSVHVFLYGCTPLPAVKGTKTPHRWNTETQAEKQNQRCFISPRHERSCHCHPLCHLDTGPCPGEHPSATATAALHLSGENIKTFYCPQLAQCIPTIPAPPSPRSPRPGFVAPAAAPPPLSQEPYL